MNVDDYLMTSRRDAATSLDRWYSGNHPRNWPYENSYFQGKFHAQAFPWQT